MLKRPRTDKILARTTPIPKLIIPSIPVNYLPRPRLGKRFQDAIRRKIILLTAPAGYGKTTFLVESLGNINHPIAWISLDPRDNHLLSFWTNIVIAIQKIRPSVGEETLAFLQNSELFMETAITDLINEINDTIPDLYIVLDDYHCIDLKAIHDSIHFLMNYLPPQSHLIISSRADPPITLVRLRGQGHVAEIKAADLRFTIEETSQFLAEVMESRLDDKEKIEFIHSRIEGWIAGLQMIVLSMQGNHNFNDLLNAFHGSQKDLLNYLTNEVLGQQEDHIRQFLLQTSIFNRLNGAMCNAVLERNDSQQILETLAAKNLFCNQIDEEGKWFRYHSIFSDALYKQLLETHPGSISFLHSRASFWFENEGFIEDAIEHALDAEDIDRAIYLLNKFAPTIIGQDKHTLLLNWVSKLPKELVERSLWANIACAVASDATRQPEKELQFARVALSISEAMQTTDHDPLYTAHILGSLAFLRAFDAYNRGNIDEAIKHSEEGLQSLPQDEVRARCGLNCVKGFAHWMHGDLIKCYSCCEEAVRTVKLVEWHYSACLAVSLVAHVRFALGRLHSATETCHEAIQMGTMQDGKEISASCFAHLLLAQTLYQQNLLDEAEGQILRAIKLSENGQEPVIWLSAKMALARIRIVQGEMDSGIEIARKAKITYERTFPNNSLADIFMTRLWLMAGYEATASDFTNSWSYLLFPKEGGLPKEKALFGLFQNGIYGNDIRNIWVEIPLLTYVRVKLNQGKLNGLIELLGHVHQDVEAKQWKGILIETMILEALVYNATGNLTAALKSLKEVVELTERENYLRIFIDEGLAMRQLLQRAVGRGITPNYVAKVLLAFNAPVSKSYEELQIKFDLPESLTKRESEIFRLICEGYSNQDIANQLFISLSTVKNHIHHIFEKLDVDNRAALKLSYKKRL